LELTRQLQDFNPIKNNQTHTQNLQGTKTYIPPSQVSELDKLDQGHLFGKTL